MADVVPSIDVVTSFKSLANAVKDTDLYKDSLKNIDDAFSDNSLSAYEQTELKANFLANITNNALNSAMSLALQEQSANAKLTEELNLIKQQIQESKDKVKMGQDELAKNIELKDKQIFGEDLKNGGVSFEYTYNDDGTVATKTLIEGTAKSIYEADIDYKVTQKRELEQSTRDNRVIKTTQTLESFNSTTGAGGLIPAEATIKRFLELAESIILPSDGVTTSPLGSNIVPKKA